ncbi:hypothetical protein WJX82_009741 [Trebouxia sp. C0006]
MTEGQQAHHNPSLIRSLCNSASAAAIAEGLTLPLDTAKVRLQLQNFSHDPVPRYRGPLQTVGRIMKDEGATAPFKGLVPGLHRQLLFTGLRLGLYDAIKGALATDGQELSVPKKVAAALCTSAIGITFANPADLVKVRLQACEHPKGLMFKQQGHGAAVADLDLKPVYKNATEAYIKIVKEEGVQGLYKGYTANLLRNSIISATEMVSYDQAKGAILHAGFADSIGVHLASGLTAGLAATVLGSPWDVIGTRLMAPGKSTGKAKQAQGLFPFIAHMLRTEGIGAFYKGFVPNFARIGSFNIVLWLSYEQIKKL